MSEDFLSILAAQQQRVWATQTVPPSEDEAPFENLTAILESDGETCEDRLSLAALLPRNLFDNVPHGTIRHFDPPLFFSYSTAALPSLQQMRN